MCAAQIGNKYWLNKHHTDEAKEKNRLAHIGRHPSGATRAKMRAAATHRHHSVATKEAIKLAHLGKPRSMETREKLRLANLGKTCSLELRLKRRLNRLGRKLNPETKTKIGRANKGRKRSPEQVAEMRGRSVALWQSPEWRDKVVRAQQVGRYVHPNKAEKAVLELLEQLYPGEWAFVGDGSLIVGGKNPDFANVNGKKALIELFGDYWHRGENPQDRIDLFARFGFKTLVIWELEMSSISRVTERVTQFVELIGSSESEHKL